MGFNVSALPPGGRACLPAGLCWTHAPILFPSASFPRHGFLIHILDLRLPFSFVVVQSLSRGGLFATPWTAAARLFCPPPSPRVCSNSCPLSRWCCWTISSTQHCFPNPILLYRPSSLSCFPPFYKYFFLPLELGISFSTKCLCRWMSKCFPVLHPSSCLDGGISGSQGPWVVRTALWTPFRSGHVNDQQL